MNDIKLKIIFHPLPHKDIKDEQALLLTKELSKYFNCKLIGTNINKEYIYSNFSIDEKQRKIKDSYITGPHNISEKEKEKIIKDAIVVSINKTQWSERILWNNYYSSRPILGIEATGIEGTLLGINIKPITGLIEDQRIRLKNFNHNELGDKVISILNFPKEVSINIESILPDEILKEISKEYLTIYKGNNNYITFVEEYSNSKDVFISLKDKIRDYEDKYTKDLKLDINELNNKLSNINFHKLLGTYKDRIDRLKIINKNFKYTIDNYYIGLFTSIGSDIPSFFYFMSKEICKYNNIEEPNDLSLLESIDNILLFNSLNIKLEAGRDPYGLKSDINKIIDYCISNRTLIKEELGDIFNKRLIEKIHSLNNSLRYINNIKSKLLLIDKDININLIRRVFNLIRKSSFSDHIELDDYEKTLDFSIDKIEELENYINTYKISPYIERRNLLDNFLKKYDINLNC